MIELPNLTLNHLVQENQVLVNGFINKVQTTEDNLLKLKIHTKTGDKTILINKKFFFISNKSEIAKQNPGGFSALLKKYLFNQRIISIKQKGFDRIVIIEFPNNYLILEFFAKGNIILCDKELIIIKALKKEKWKDRELSKDNKYLFPSSRGQNPLEITVNDFYEKLKTSEKTLFGATLDIINVAPILIELIFDEINIQKTINAKNIDEKNAKTLLEKIQKIYSKKEEKVFLRENILFSICINKEPEKNYQSINDALNQLEKRTEKKVEKKKQVINYDLQQQKFLEEELLMKKKGENIYLNYNELNEIIQEIKNNKKEVKNNKGIIKVKEIDLKRNKLIVEL